MGTERSLEYEQKCACGAGFYRIYECTPDHGWPNSQRLWYEQSLDCPACAKTDVIERYDQKFIVVKRQIIAQREALSHDAYVRGESLMKSPQVVALLASLEALLASQKSVAATARLLKNAGLSYSSEGAFRNHWRTPHAWVSGNIRANHLEKVMLLLKQQPPDVLAEIKEISSMSAAADLLAKPTAEPFFVLAGPAFG